MIRAVALSLALAGPAAADGLTGQALCTAIWAESEREFSDLQVGVAATEGDWCVFTDVALDWPGSYTPDWHIARLRFRGGAFAWVMDGVTTPDRLELEITGLRLVVQTGNPQMDYLFAAQSHPNRIDAELAVAWDAQQKTLNVERLWIDFPGDNFVEFSARADGVDLSSSEAINTSLETFAIKETDLVVRSHGLFEWYALMSLGPIFLPSEGDMEAAARSLRREMIDMISGFSDTTLPVQSKVAVGALIAELPNPSGTLTIRQRSEKGIALHLFIMAFGFSDSLLVAFRTALSDSSIDIEWSHEDAD